jgi:hypothetical protein
VRSYCATMPILSASVAHALWRIAVPSIVVNAGSGGAMLSITLLKPTVLTLYGGHAFVLHDPLGLMGDRLLAHVHRAVVSAPAPPAAACRWVTARGPLSAVWEAADAMAARGVWRVPRRRWPETMRRDGGRAARVAETRLPYARDGDALGVANAPSAAMPGASPSPYGEQPRVLLLSESDRADALAPHTAARLLLRATRHEWAVFAVTRQGPARLRAAADEAPGATVSVADAPRARRSRVELAERPWRTHLVCRSGALEPLPVVSPMPEIAAVRTAHRD